MEKYRRAPDNGCRSRSSFNAALLASMLFLLASFKLSCGFSPSLTAGALGLTRHHLQSLLPLNSEVQASESIGTWAEDDGDGGMPQLAGSLANARLLAFELLNHKPLGCSVEESLADEPDGSKYVFVAEVKKDGNAAKAGLREGDVIVQLSGTFDEVVDVAGLGIEKIRSLVAGRPDDSPLKICVARGSDVKQRHEMSLVELCIIGDDAATVDCITSIYAADDDIFIAGDSDMAMCDEDDGTECMLDSMWSDWSDDVAEKEKIDKAPEEQNEKKKVAPWSSRSSPSGTYVRDPKTGKLVNIDE